MRKPTICICKNKYAVTAKTISAFVFATRIVQFLYFLKPKFPAPNYLLCLYSLVCVRPVLKPHCWFSHEAAQIVVWDVKHLINIRHNMKLFIGYHPTLSTLHFAYSHFFYYNLWPYPILSLRYGNIYVIRMGLLYFVSREEIVSKKNK